jgi:aromatic-L-amino-acid decarboxylase
MPNHPNLDPSDWDEFAAEAHSALDRMIAYLRTSGDRKVWEPAPQDTLNTFRETMPREARKLSHVLGAVRNNIEPYVTGNTHPMFFGWAHGAGTPYGMLAEMIAAGLNANCGGRNHIGIEVERQITRWSAELFGFPRSSSGLFVTGTSAANFVATLIARNEAGLTGRREGLRNGPQLTAYTSSEAHRCIAQALDMSGIGSDHLRLLPVDERRCIRADVLREKIAEDRSAGFRPFLIVGSAGTVNTGAFDDLKALADVASSERLWFHVDGAFGALAALSPTLRPLLNGIERADSLAFDFHKAVHVPYDAGFILVQDADAHRRAFDNPAAYLQREDSGLAAGVTWPSDLGPDLSRGFRALKTWFTFQALGADRIGQSIEQSVRLANELRSRLAKSKTFRAHGYSAFNIVCFSHRHDESGSLNRRIAIDLQDRGVAAPSVTWLDGTPVLRAAILNHRTTSADIEKFIGELDISAGRVTTQSG